MPVRIAATQTSTSRPAIVRCQRRRAPKMKPRKKNSSAIGAITHTKTAAPDERRRARADAQVLGELVGAVEVDDRLIERGHHVVADGAQDDRANPEPQGDPPVAEVRRVGPPVQGREVQRGDHERRVEHDVADQAHGRAGVGRSRPRPLTPTMTLTSTPTTSPPASAAGPSRSARGRRRDASRATGSARRRCRPVAVSCGGGTLGMLRALGPNDGLVTGSGDSGSCRLGKSAESSDRLEIVRTSGRTDRRPGTPAPARSRRRARRRRPPRGCRRRGSSRSGRRRPAPAPARRSPATACARRPRPRSGSRRAAASSASARSTACSETSQLLTTTSRAPARGGEQRRADVGEGGEAQRREQRLDSRSGSIARTAPGRARPQNLGAAAAQHGERRGSRPSSRWAR